MPVGLYDADHRQSFRTQLEAWGEWTTYLPAEGVPLRRLAIIDRTEPAPADGLSVNTGASPGATLTYLDDATDGIETCQVDEGVDKVEFELIRGSGQVETLLVTKLIPSIEGTAVSAS